MNDEEKLEEKILEFYVDEYRGARLEEMVGCNVFLAALVILEILQLIGVV